LLYVCLCVTSQQTGIVEPEETAFVRKQFGRKVLAATNTHTRMEEPYDALFSMLSVLYQMLNM
jgi:hypothetical protein